MNTINPLKCGLSLGILIGGWHFLWSLLVAIGWAQSVIDFVLWMHFIKPVYVIAPFDFATAVILVLVTSTFAFAVGYAFSLVWNKVLRPIPVVSSGPKN